MSMLLDNITPDGRYRITLEEIPDVGWCIVRYNMKYGGCRYIDRNLTQFWYNEEYVKEYCRFRSVKRAIKKYYRYYYSLNSTKVKLTFWEKFQEFFLARKLWWRK